MYLTLCAHVFVFTCKWNKWQQWYKMREELGLFYYCKVFALPKNYAVKECYITKMLMLYHWMKNKLAIYSMGKKSVLNTLLTSKTEYSEHNLTFSLLLIVNVNSWIYSNAEIPSGTRRHTGLSGPRQLRQSEERTCFSIEETEAQKSLRDKKSKGQMEWPKRQVKYQMNVYQRNQEQRML